MKRFFSFLLLITITFAASAETYKVDSEEKFKSVLEKLQPGDEVIILNGSYQNWALEIASQGTAEQPILIRAESSEKVVFTGNADQTLFKLTGSYIKLSGITFNNCVLQKNNGNSGVLVEMKNSTNCAVSHCVFSNNVVKAQFMPLLIISGKGSYNVVENCSFISNIDNQDVQVKVTKESAPQFSLITKNTFRDKERVSWANQNGGECVQVGQDPVLLGAIETHTTVSDNRFIRCDGENEVISNKCSSNQYLKNYFDHNDGELVMRGGHDCMIADNTFIGGTGGIRINGSGHIIKDNKIDGIKTAIRLMYGMAKGKNETGFYIAASGCSIENNKISNAQTGILIGDSKNADWTGKFDVKRYPSPVIQGIAPFDNEISGNVFVKVKIHTLTH